MIYDNILDACKRKHTTITEVLVNLGRATGSTGSWKSGSYPNMKIAMEIAEHLNITLDELCYGREHFENTILNAHALSVPQKELLSLFNSIPEGRRQMCLDFLRTHAELSENKSKLA